MCSSSSTTRTRGCRDPAMSSRTLGTALIAVVGLLLTAWTAVSGGGLGGLSALPGNFLRATPGRFLAAAEHRLREWLDDPPMLTIDEPQIRPVPPVPAPSKERWRPSQSLLITAAIGVLAAVLYTWGLSSMG